MEVHQLLDVRILAPFCDGVFSLSILTALTAVATVEVSVEERGTGLGANYRQIVAYLPQYHMY